MTDQVAVKPRRGRDATTAAILDAAEELFSLRGYMAVTVRDIAEHAGISHPLVHQYVGSKADVLRAVVARNENLLASAAPDNLDLLESTRLILRNGLEQRGRAHARLLMRSALDDVPYERSTGRFAAIERLIVLAEQAAAAASSAERAEKDLDPRLVVACVGSLFLGWVSGEPWMRPAAGLTDMDDAELADGLERVLLSVLSDHVPGVASEGASSTEIEGLKAELAAIRDELAAVRGLLTPDDPSGAVPPGAQMDQSLTGR
jgi:AcrR family transcriptional regulator